MVEVNVRDVIYNWYVTILIFIWMFLNTLMSIFSWTKLYPEYDFIKYKLILLAVVFALIVAGTLGSIILRGLTATFRFIGRRFN